MLTHIVWSFGVVMWEILTHGLARPYGTIENRYIAATLKEGKRLQQPPECPEAMFQLMLRCWVLSSKARPSFTELKTTLIHLKVKLSSDTPRYHLLTE